MPAFAEADYRARLSRVRDAMARRGIDVLVVSDPANMTYLTGYDAWSFYVHQCVLVTADALPVWIGREMDVAGARLTTWLPERALRGYDETYVDSDTRHPMEVVADTIRSAAGRRARVGVEKDCWYFPARSAEVLTAALPDAHFADAFGMVNRVRLVKSEAEIAYMRIAGEIAGRAMRAGLDTVAVGVRECDVAAAVTHAQFAGTETAYGDYPAALVQAPSGERTAAPHLTWSGTRYVAGSVGYLELAGCHQRYHAPLARSFCLGDPPDWLRDMVPVVEEGMAAVLDAARAGTTAEAVEATWRAVIAKAGYAKDSRIGYSIGLGYPPDWGERTASLRPGDTTVLEQGMCFHVILGMWRDDGGYEASESICIRAGGAPELLTRFPRDLTVIG